jgi:hypothetical protein
VYGFDAALESSPNKFVVRLAEQNGCAWVIAINCNDIAAV